MATQAQLTAVQQLYVGYLGRAADAEGQKFWADAIANGTATIASVATGFTLSAEYKAAYAGLDSAALVDKIYNNVLGRSADAEGKAFWVDALANGTVATDTLLATMITNLGALDQQTINNKVFVAQTYTDTVGADYNPEAGKQVLAGVTNDPATVQDAIDLINTGTLPGGVPGLGLINAVVSAEAAVTAYEKEVATSNATLDDNTDGVVTSAEAGAALTDAEAARFDAVTGVSTKSTGVLAAEAADAATATAAAKAAASAQTDGAAAVAAFDSAVAAKTAADDAVTANATAAASAAAGLHSALGVDGATVTYATLNAAAGGAAFATAADVIAFLADSTSNPLHRAALVTELNKVPTYGAEVVKEGNLELAAAKANIALSDATTDLQAIDSDAGTAGSEGQDYIDAKTAQVAADKTLADAKAADEKVAAIQTVVDKFDSLEKAVADAQKALTDFGTENAAKVTFHDIAAGTVTADAKSDVFYFADKAAGADDLTVNSFGSGDSIVLGSSFTQGAIGTADSNKLEFFLVQGSAGVQVVVEGVEYANASTTVDASGNVTASPEASVITLTGVSLADIAVNNGVITHV
ncbi:hypothetical protein BLX42_17020 [Pseudomonas sp. SG-MS2]|uniref:DUF4214 domain-containing protein n=1 Tax=Pseudomonas sp. SG-MS2 TaxID=1914534 RepID=UPI00137AC0C9|nr:DUF4214 domain-containing protein [Pseudomonas sp. SG-MS2]KAF1309875.1 hypothetical protein BLX42_17020 [Pseudomonas sp. SG-MS2]